MGSGKCSLSTTRLGRSYGAGAGTGFGGLRLSPGGVSHSSGRLFSTRGAHAISSSDIWDRTISLYTGLVLRSSL